MPERNGNVFAAVWLSFNSLFEMQVLEELKPHVCVVVVLSILYLRCTLRNTPALSG